MKAKFQNFVITANYTGSKAAPWSDRYPVNYNHHNVTVTNTTTGKRTRFDFWASIAKPELETEYDIINAFYCFVTDACSGAESFEDFCSEFGYDTDSRTAEKTWKACRRSAAKLERISDVDIYDLANALNDAEYC